MIHARKVIKFGDIIRALHDKIGVLVFPLSG